MSTSFTTTETTTFTYTHARHISAKVAADLKRMQRFYDAPSDARIAEFEEELRILLRYGCLGTVTYGFRRNGMWIEPMIIYTARDLEGASADDNDPGRIYPGANISRASFGSYLVYGPGWYQLTKIQQDALEALIPVKRSHALEPARNGYLSYDKTYSAGGRALNRASLVNFQ